MCRGVVGVGGQDHEHQQRTEKQVQVDLINSYRLLR